jgi:hypothetical protein
MSHGMSSLMLHDKQSLEVFDNPTRKNELWDVFANATR